MTPIDFGQFSTDGLRLIAPEVGHIFKRREKRARNTFVALYAHLKGEEGAPPIVSYLFLKLGGSDSRSESWVTPDQIHPATGGAWEWDRISVEANRPCWWLEWNERHAAKRINQVRTHLKNIGGHWHAIDTRAATVLGDITPGSKQYRGNLYL